MIIKVQSQKVQKQINEKTIITQNQIKKQNKMEFSRIIYPFKSDQKVSKIIIKEIPSVRVMFWCYNCQVPVNSVQQLRCELCSCEAIEQISSQSNPQGFQPYVSESNNQGENSNVGSDQNGNHSFSQSQSIFSSLGQEPFGMQMMQSMSNFGMMGGLSTILTEFGGNNSPIFIRYTVARPAFGILLINGEEGEKVSVPEQKINSLEKVQIKDECAICQQKEGAGLRLPCQHEFHENCIKPWFQEANTCPCCRTTV